MRQTVDKVNQPSKPRGAADIGEQLHAELHTLMHRIKRHLHHAARTLPEGLAPMEMRALAFFARHPGGSARDLVEHAGRDKAQVARLVRSLTERGLLAASASPQDQRVLCLTLTDAGLALQRQLAQARRRVDAALLAGLNAAEQQQMAQLLARMNDTLGEP
jgi:DNA-binding MarR family transcriptional regulator